MVNPRLTGTPCLFDNTKSQQHSRKICYFCVLRTLSKKQPSFEETMCLMQFFIDSIERLH